MRKISLAVMGLLIMAMFAMVAPTVEARIGPPGAQYDREAMISEAYFAVTGVVGYRPTPTSNLLGQWNYMTYDIPAQNIIIERLGSANAGWTTPVAYDANHPNGWVPNGYYQNIGRGGQCLFFVNLLLYRSEADRRDYSSGTCNYCWSYIEAHSVAIDSVRPKAGDIVFRPRDLAYQPPRWSPHIAVIVYRDVADPNKVLIVDSNFANGAGNEEAALRPTTITWLQNNGYQVYTGVSYYNN